MVVKLERLTQGLAQIRTAQEAKKVVAQADAAERYARIMGLGEEAEGHCYAIKTEAKKILGDMERARPKNRGAASQRGSVGPATQIDIGLVTQSGKKAKRLIADAALLSRLAEEAPEEYEAVKARRKRLTQVKRDRTRQAKLRRLQEFPGDKYRVIYADPPWQYRDAQQIGTDEQETYLGVGQHYPSMSMETLCNLPVKGLAEREAVLFLWVTTPLLAEVWPVIAAWGFQYKSEFVWDKVRPTFGHYNAMRHEHLLVCTRGQCTPDIEERPHSILQIRRAGAHSTKPPEFRRLIDTLYPFGKRIELFARGNVPENWERWGTEE
jgi:N6-adenosine-specific RNA methylase IME4